MGKLEWEIAEENDMGIETVAYTYKNSTERVLGYIRGINGMEKGNRVMYGGDEYIIVEISRMGYIGISKTGKFPSTRTVKVSDLIQV